MPKAVYITHEKALKFLSVIDLSGITEDDVLYTPLPLYHGAAWFFVFGAVMAGRLSKWLQNHQNETQKNSFVIV